jgi:hypothetical protein
MSSLVSFLISTTVDTVHRVRRAVWRNRRRVAVLAVALSVAVLGWRALWRRVDAMQRERLKSLEARSSLQSRRRAYFGDSQATADAYVRASLPTLAKRVDALLALPSPLELRGAGGSKERKLELWSAFKVDSFARLLAAVYALCCATVVVRVQLNLVSRYVHLRTLEPDDAAPVDDDRRVQRQVAALLDDATQTEFFTRGKHLEQAGLDDIVDALKHACAAAVEPRALDEPLDASSLLRLVDDIRAALGPRGEHRLMVRAVLSPEAVASAADAAVAGELDVVSLLVSETLGVLESDACGAALDKCVSECVALALDGIAGEAGTPLVRLVVHIGRAADKMLLEDGALRLLSENNALRSLSFATFTEGLD